jgi:hypothetical protein
LNYDGHKTDVTANSNKEFADKNSRSLASSRDEKLVLWANHLHPKEKSPPGPLNNRLVRSQSYYEHGDEKNQNSLSRNKTSVIRSTAYHFTYSEITISCP